MIAKRFETLDAIRGIAAVIVVFRHSTAFGDLAADSHSYLAVDLFFVLSGFVIAHAYENLLLGGSMTPGRFVLVRLIRLYPLFLMAVLISAVVALALQPSDATNASQGVSVAPGVDAIVLSSTLALFFLPSSVQGSALLFPLNTALWSLMFEMAVNVLYGTIFVKLSTRTLTWVVAGCGFAVAVFALRRNGLDWGWAWGVGSIVPGLLRAGVGFGLGVLLRRKVGRSPESSLSVPAWIVLGIATVPLLIPDMQQANPWIDLLAVFVIFPVCILLGAQARSPARLLRASFVLGTASYPIYVLHVPALRLFEWMLEALGLADAKDSMVVAIAGGAFLVMLIALALALDRWYDRPVRNALTTLLRRAKSARAIA